MRKNNDQSFDQMFRDFYRVHRTAEGRWGAFLFYNNMQSEHTLTQTDRYSFYRMGERRFADFFDERSLKLLSRRFGEANGTLGTVVSHVAALKDVARTCGRGDGRVPRPN